MAMPGKRKGRVNTFNVLILLFVGLGSMSYGYTASIIGTTLGQPSFISYFELDTRENGTDLISTTNGLFQAGGVVGTLLLPNISDRYGRKWGIAIVSSITFIVLSWADGYTECYVSYFIWRFSRRQHQHRRIHLLPLYCRCQRIHDPRGHSDLDERGRTCQDEGRSCRHTRCLSDSWVLHTRMGRLRLLLRDETRREHLATTAGTTMRMAAYLTERAVLDS